MKSFFLALVIFPSVLMAQTTQGKIIFKEISKFDIPEKYRQYMPADTPDSVVNEMELSFNATNSLYKTYENLEEEEKEPTQFEKMMKMWGGGADNQVYRDLTSKIQLEKKDFQGKVFLIKSEITDTVKWKINPIPSKILGYTCMEATTVKDSTEVKVWFSTEIPVPFGPMTVGGLPGMVLKMEINSGKFFMRIIADSFEAKKVKTLKSPKGGETVTQEEFDAIMKAKMEEMKKMRGSGNGPHGH